MKKRIITAFLTLFALAFLTPAAFAAVETGGVKYLWTTEPGGTIHGEYDEATGDCQVLGYRGQKFLISADGGASYAELPGLREQSEKVWSDYRTRVLPLEGGGLRLEAWGEWETEVTWTRDYTAAELSAALKNTVPVPVRVRCTNGTITLATREVSDNYNDDPAYAPWEVSWQEDQPTVAGVHLLWSADGVTWNDTGLTGYAPWCEAGAFYNYDYYDGVETSTDGVHWTKLEGRKRSTDLRYACDLGKYHFEVVDPDDYLKGNDVYLMDQTSREVGVLLPDLGSAIRAMGVGVGDIQAWYTPNDTVTVAVYDYNQGEDFMYSLTYPISSLDWCLENLSAPFRSIEVKATDGKVSLGLTAPSNVGWFREEGALLRNDGSGWKPVTGMPWGNTLSVLPYNGKTFMVRDTAALTLYASADGLTWTEVGTLKPEGMKTDGYDYINYDFTWTGKEYIACREAAVRRHGMMGYAGGNWYEGNTKVYFLTDSFQVTGSYDFGRLVEKVGYWNGAYYARVSNSAGSRYGFSGDDVYDESLGSTLYRSADGRTWTALPDIYVEYDDIMISPVGGSIKNNFPTNDPAKPLRTVAALDDLRFALMGEEGKYTVAVMLDSALHWEKLEGMEEAIRDSWIIPGEVTAQYEEDKVRVTVRDMSTPTMTCSRAYPVQELKSLQFGLKGWDWQPTLEPVREQGKDGAADVAMLERLNGEREIIHRSAATDGKYQFLEKAPWSNSIELLPYSGKDFIVWDKVDGRYWLSSDGAIWREAPAKGWFNGQGEDYAYVAMVWVGDRYMACCQGSRKMEHRGEMPVWAGFQVTFLDEDLNKTGESGRLGGTMVSEIGFRDGIYYVDCGGVYCSTDGKTWVMMPDLLDAQFLLR